MYRRLILFAMTVFVFLAQIGVVTACNASGYQPKLPEALKR